MTRLRPSGFGGQAQRPSGSGEADAQEERIRAVTRNCRGLEQWDEAVWSRSCCRISIAILPPWLLTPRHDPSQ
jgi:hypothetical protein